VAPEGCVPICKLQQWPRNDHLQSSATVSLTFCKKTKHRGNPFGRKAVLLIVDADAQLLSGFPATSEDLVQFPGSIISISLPIN
jgi:hypothetical protein